MRYEKSSPNHHHNICPVIVAHTNVQGVNEIIDN